MLKQSRIYLDAIFQPMLALYLGFVFSEFFLKGLIPDSLAAPGVFISGMGFFLALRWLSKATPHNGRTQAANSPAALNTAAAKVSSCGKRCLLPPISFKHTLFPNWLSSSRNRVFAGKDRGIKPRVLPSAQLWN